MLRIALTSVVVALTVVFALGPLVQAQQPPQSPPTWQQGRPPELSNSPLAPVAAPPTPTPAAQIPVNRIKLPPGFKISGRADGSPNAGQRAWGDKARLV